LKRALSLPFSTNGINNIKEQINHQNLEKRHRGVKKTKKQRNFNLGEHYKIENNHYRDYES